MHLCSAVNVELVPGRYHPLVSYGIIAGERAGGKSAAFLVSALRWLKRARVEHLCAPVALAANERRAQPGPKTLSSPDPLAPYASHRPAFVMAKPTR